MKTKKCPLTVEIRLHRWAGISNKTPGYDYAFRTSAGILLWLRYPTGRAQRWKLRRHPGAGTDLGDDPGHDAGKDLDKIRLALLQLAGQAGQREGIQDECPLDGQQAAVARPADQGRAGGDDAVRVAQGVEGVHRDLPRRKAVHKVDVNYGQFSGIMYAVHQPVYGRARPAQQSGLRPFSQRRSPVRPAGFQQEDALGKTPFLSIT